MNRSITWLISVQEPVPMSGYIETFPKIIYHPIGCLHDWVRLGSISILIDISIDSGCHLFFGIQLFFPFIFCKICNCLKCSPQHWKPIIADQLVFTVMNRSWTVKCSPWNRLLRPLFRNVHFLNGAFNTLCSLHIKIHP